MTKRFFLTLFTFVFTVSFINADPRNDVEQNTTTANWRNQKNTSYMGIRFGLNVPTIYYRGTGGLAQTNPQPRFNLSFVYGKKLGNNIPLYLETGLTYTEKGAEIKETDEEELRECNLKYLQIPIVLKYKWKTNIDDFSVQPFFGAYLATGVGGQTKYYTTRTKRSSFGDDRYNRFDAGIRLGCGLSYQNFYFETGYEIGLYNIAGDQYTAYHYDDFDGHIRNGNYFLTLGVDF